MRLSKGFWQTFKEVPADAEIPSHQLMVRAGLIHKSGAGLYNYLPFGLKIVQKVAQVVREEMNRAGAFEIQMTFVTPSELWRESGRWDVMTEMCKFTDKREAEVCISPTNEEAVVDIFRKNVKSYKQLPVNLYQINTKFRDEIRPRFGLMRAREFLMKDAYSFHTSKESLDDVYADMAKAYERVFARLGLNFVAVEADAGAMASSDQQTHEYQVLASTGEDIIVYGRQSQYAANVEKAKTKRPEPGFDFTGGELEDVETPGCLTIEDVCRFLKRPQEQSLKSLVYKGVAGDAEIFVLAMLLGDDELNEVKLKAHLGVDHLLPATVEEMEKLNLIKGYIGPVGKEKTFDRIVFDNEVREDAFYVVGANKVDYHSVNFRLDRELSGKNYERTDIRLACEGDLTVDGKEEIEFFRGIEVGHIFQLGDKYTRSMDVSVLDQKGKAVYPVMGCYGIGVTRVVAAAIEQNHDDKGIIWPVALAPADVHFVAITKSEETAAKADEVYDELLKNGFDVVYDDRKAGVGFKFKDADLLGLPLQLVFGERDFQKDGTLEIRRRKDGKAIKVSKDEVVETVKKTYNFLRESENKTINKPSANDPLA